MLCRLHITTSWQLNSASHQPLCSHCTLYSITVPSKDQTRFIKMLESYTYDISVYTVCVCVRVCCHPIYSRHQVCGDQPGTYRRKVTRDFSAFLLRCLPKFLSRERFSHSFPSSTVKSNFAYERFNRFPLCINDKVVLHLLGIFIFFVKKNPSSCDDTKIRTHNVKRFRGYLWGPIG